MAEVGLDPVAVATMTSMRWADSTEGVQVALHNLGGKGAQVLLAHFAPAVTSALHVLRFLQYPDLGHSGPQQDPARIAADIGEAWRSPPKRKQPT